MNTQLKSLTGLRFFAAFLVVMHHLFIPKGPAFAHNIVFHGFTAVTLFFVLSGFILAYSYLDNGGQMKTSRWNFWVARFARIYPVYLVAFLMFVPFVRTSFMDENGAVPSLGDYGIVAGTTLTLVQSWSTYTVGIWNAPSWSLSAEAFFYLTFPFMAPAIMRFSLRRLVLVAGLLWLLSVVAQFTHIRTGVDLGQKFWMFNPVLRLPEFLLGIVLAKCWKASGGVGLGRHSGWVSVAAVAAIGAVLAVGADDIWFYNGALAPLMMVLIYSLASGQGLLARILASKPLVLLGEASYSLYLLHWPLWMIFGGLVSANREAFRAGPLIYFSVLSISVSVAVFKLVEHPANRAIRKSLSSARRCDDVLSAAPELAK